MTKRRSYGVALSLLLILLLAGALRVYDLGGESLWLDETHSIDSAQHTVSEILTVVPMKYVQPPLYFLLLRGWVRLVGDSAVAVRAPSVVFGVAVVAVLFLVGIELRDVALGLAVAFLAAISYFLIYYAQEARPYSLLVLLSAASYYFFIRMVRRGEAGKTAVGYAASTVLLLYTHYHAAFLVLAQLGTVACLWRRLRKVRLRWLVAVAVATLAFSPWLPTLWAQIQIVAGDKGWWIPIPTIDSLLQVNALWVPRPFRYSIGPLAISFTSFTRMAAFFWLLVLMGCFLWARAPASTSSRHRSRPTVWAPADETVLLACWLLVPILTPFALSQVGPSVFWPRYLIGAAPAFYLLVARGVVALNRRWFAGGLCLLVLALSMPGLQVYYRVPQKEQWDEVGHLLEREGQAGDLVVLAQGYLVTPLVHYYRGPMDRFAINDHDDPVEASRRIEGAMVDHRRIWLVVSHAPKNTAVRVLRELVPRGAVARHRFVKIDVFLYEIPPNLSKQAGRFKLPQVAHVIVHVDPWEAGT
jgi:mannosyltransferase